MHTTDAETSPPSQSPTSRRADRRRTAEARPRRGIWIAGLLVLAAVVGVPAYGYYDVFIAPLQEPIVRVNDTVLTMGDYVERLRYLVAETELLGGRVNLASDPFRLLGDMRNGELIRQGAPRLSLSASDEEITTAIKERLSALPKEGEEATEAELERLFQESYKQYLTSVHLSDATFRELTEEKVLREKLREALSDRVPAVAEHAHVLAIKVDEIEVADQIMKRLDKGEESFATIARAESTDAESRENRGDLGWIPRRAKAPAFDETAFSVPEGTVGEPFFMDGGFWIIKVIGRDATRKVEGKAREQLKDRALEDWLEEETKENLVESYFDSDRYQFVVNKVGEYRRSFGQQ